MRLYVEILVIWTIVALLLGWAGQLWINAVWRGQIESSFNRDATAVVSLVEAMEWSEPAEGTPQWEELEQELGVGVIPRQDLEVGELPLKWTRVAGRAAGSPESGRDRIRFRVLGDNPEASDDSRTFGPVPMHRFRGRVVFRYWPPSRFGPIE